MQRPGHLSIYRHAQRCVAHAHVHFYLVCYVSNVSKFLALRCVACPTMRDDPPPRLKRLVLCSFSYRTFALRCRESRGFIWAGSWPVVSTAMINNR
jgi:hypothetical protein